MVLRPGFEPGSRGREPPMLGRTTIGIAVELLQRSTGARNGMPVRSARAPFRALQISFSPWRESVSIMVYQITELYYSNYPAKAEVILLLHPVPTLWLGG